MYLSSCVLLVLPQNPMSVKPDEDALAQRIILKYILGVSDVTMWIEMI
jgi:hypothetical protein